MLSLLFQLERSQWLAPEILTRHQLPQVDSVLRHAYASVPWYRDHWRNLYDPGVPISLERLARLPLLTRRDLQQRYEALKSTRIPPEHGVAEETRSSGSTGSPVRVARTQLSVVFWKAFTLRDHLWHRRDMGKKLAVIRRGFATGTAASWGYATEGLVSTGPAAMLEADASVDSQLKWLEAEQPSYLITYPTLAAELARTSLARKRRLKGLIEVRTLGEMLPPDLRELCREAWGARVTDMYSSEETGYIALQCPEHEHYHVQSEGVLVEVVDENGRPCAPGKIGRVIVTSLHNFAMPLIRYDIGDYAEAGEACPCGRGLPVLRRITGRVRNMLVTASGDRYWPALGSRKMSAFPQVLQHQFVQKQFDLVEVRLVISSPLDAAQERGLRRLILGELPRGIQIRFAYCESIPRSAGGKFEDFISEVAQPPVR